ncbi:MAG TPA: cell division protein ZipA [Porticoccaceae bacterium]|nr:cell division protein ZipA [Porticoccaceae bacterium]
MDFLGPREVVIVVGILALVAIILDGARRIKRNRYEKLQMSSRNLHKNSDAAQYENHDGLDESQFPSGGSRLIGSRTFDDNSVPQGHAFNFDRTPQQENFDLDNSIFATPEATTKPSPAQKASTHQGSSELAGSSQEVLVVHLVADKGATIDGGHLLDTALAAGLRYGEMKIFHRHLNDDGSGPVLFSMANLVNPGTFHLNTIKSIATPGITLFMELNEIEDPVAAFDLMIESIDILAAKGPFNVMDESRSSMTRQTIDHYRQLAKSAASRAGKD